MYYDYDVLWLWCIMIIMYYDYDVLWSAVSAPTPIINFPPRVARTNAGVFDNPRHDGQESTCSLRSSLHSNYHHQHHHHHPLQVNPLKPSLGGVGEPPLPLGGRHWQRLRDRGVVCWKDHTRHRGNHYHCPGHYEGWWEFGSSLQRKIIECDFNSETQIIKSSTSSLLLSAFNIFILIAGWSKNKRKQIHQTRRRNLSSQIISIIFRPDQDFPSRRASDC